MHAHRIYMAKKTSGGCPDRTPDILIISVLFIILLIPTLLGASFIDGYIEDCHTTFDDRPIILEHCVSKLSTPKYVLWSLPFLGLIALVIHSRDVLFCR